MQTRRNFFGNLGAIIAAAAAPTIFIPTGHVNWGKPTIYVPKTYRLKAFWSPELIQDLQAYHNINAEAEIQALMKHYIQQEIPEDVRIVKTEYETVGFDHINFMPKREVVVTVEGRIS